jgi:hypothetical protein
VATAVVDSILGSFDWDDHIGCLQGRLYHPSGGCIELHVNLSTAEHASNPNQPSVFTPLRKVVNWLREAEERVRLVVADKMVQLYNRSWSREAEDIPPEEFARRIEMVALSVESDGTEYELIDNDGEMEMFMGHQIAARFDADGELLDVGM